MAVGGQQGAPGFDAERLRAARRDARLTQRELAAQVGATETAIANWEGGGRSPRVDRLAQLARALGVRPIDLTDAAGTGTPSLLQLRLGAGLLQEQVAERAGMTRQKYQTLETGAVASLSGADATALAGALDVDAGEVRAAHAVSRAEHLGTS
jgi:transcriptional regulator with XRE-family HTH domain